MKGGGSVMEFEEIYNMYFNDVYLYICRLSGDVHIAEEITSDTFFKAMGSIDSFRGECNLRVWLCQIAKNSYLSYQKKHSRSISLEDAELRQMSNPEYLIEERIEKCEDARLLQSILHKLPEPYKEVFMWRVYADLSFKQIGQIFHKSDNWACVTYHRARKMIKDRLEGNIDEK